MVAFGISVFCQLRRSNDLHAAKAFVRRVFDGNQRRYLFLRKRSEYESFLHHLSNPDLQMLHYLDLYTVYPKKQR